MTFLIRKVLNRRAALRGLFQGTGVAVALPFLDCMLNESGTALAAGGPLPVRFGTWFWGLGFNPGREIKPLANHDFEFLEEDVEVRSQELKMASSLIDSMAADFDPAAYTDQYREALEELVEAKIEGHEVAAPTPVREEKPVTSLADALRASLAAAGGGGDDGPARPGRPVSASEPKRAPRRSA